MKDADDSASFEIKKEVLGVKAKRVCNIICDACIAGVFFCVFLVQILKFVGIETYIVRSGSMEPTFMTGSLCFVNTAYDYEDISLNDVVAFKINDTMVTHRVEKITDEGFITKGDNNELSDGLTTNRSNYAGKSIFSIPYMGYLLSMLQTKRGKVLSGTLFLGLVLIDLLILEMKKSKK